MLFSVINYFKLWGYCVGDPDQIITWRGPIATFWWDSATDVNFKNLSVREIEPSK